MRKKYLYPVILFFLLSVACEKIENVNPVPSISFKEFTMERGYVLGNLIWKGTLVFEFIDEDGGNLSGMFEKDTIDTIFSVLFTPFIKVDNQYIQSDFDTLNFYLTYDKKNSRHEEIQKKGQNKSLKGDWEISILYFIKPPADTIRYEFYMVDRQGNKSNVEVTSDIAFN
jgi:hypothetical protein